MSWLRFWTGRTFMALVVFALVVGLAYTFPLDFAFLFALDLATWLEAAVFIWAATQATRIRPLVALVRARLFASHRGCGRRRRSQNRKSRLDASNDDPCDPDLAWAA
jgi:hypothetical protein